MAVTNNTFDKNSYLTFDGTSIRDVIIERLNKEGIFTDQNYQGSNMSALNDIISYTFSTLLYYLNKTSSESMFSESQIYENMNRIVNSLNYKPIGKIGQSVPAKVYTNTLTKGNYTIPRYSYITAGGTPFSFGEDVSFTKLVDGDENITDIDNKYNLKQGLYVEHPTYTATGIDNEIVFLSTKNVDIDHFGIDVYVQRESSDVWEKWDRVSELFTKKSNEKCYEVRYNQNKNYEICFGDDINGSKLRTNDLVSIFYLKIDPDSVSIGSNALAGSIVLGFNSSNYSTILSDTTTNFGTYLTSDTLRYLSLDNDFSSAPYSAEESVDSIRRNAPKTFRTQNRLVTSTDFDTYIRTNFPNILTDTKILNNEEYLETHIKYLYNIGLNKPQLESSILYNQVNFATSCNFNNIYFYGVPKNENQQYLSPSQKSLILESLKDTKVLTSDIVPIDPVYMYIDFYLPTGDINYLDIGTTKLYIYKHANTRRASSAILSDVINTFKKYFSRSVNTLGQKINIYEINSTLLNIDGIASIQTGRTDSTLKIDGLSFLIWNSIYPKLDAKTYSQNINLENFQYPIFKDIANLSNRIVVVENSGFIKSSEF